MNVDSFARFYELHPQKRTKRLVEDGPLLSAQYGTCTFTPRQESVKKNLKKLDLSYAQKNRWDSKWLNYWFYLKASVLEDSKSEPLYPFLCQHKVVS